MWLDQHPDITNYVIIDDRTDFLAKQLSHYVHVDSYRGFTDENYKQALNILTNNEGVA